MIRKTTSRKTKPKTKAFQLDDDGWIVGPMGERYGRLVYANKVFEQYLLDALNAQSKGGV